MRVLPTMLAAGALALSSLAQPAAAQVPDGLDGGPCCTPATEVLPFFPTFFQDTLEVCWLDCNVEEVVNYRARWSKLKPVPDGAKHCGRFVARLKLFDSSGALAWTGRVNLVYSRTWFESDGANQRLQVWRFLTNMNLKDVSGGASIPCPVPNCAPAFGNRIRTTGYIDYAQDLVDGTIRNAWSMSHVCDAIDHAPGFPRNGAFHPDRSYSFVGPAAGFAINPVQPPVVGGTPFEAVRRDLLKVGSTLDTLCQFEEQIQAQIDPAGQFCLCGDPSGPQQWTQSALAIFGACGTSAFTAGGPFLPGYLSMAIGGWTDPLTYPGVEELKWSASDLEYFEPCTGVTRNEVFYGVTTQGGYDAISIISTGLGPDIPESFIDQGNSLRKSNPNFTIMNLPYLTDHILNLNF